MNLLQLTLSNQIPLQREGTIHDFKWQWLAEGILQCMPKQNYTRSIVLSAGIHGNETAPIEILNQICLDLFQGKLKLKQRVLFILGNPLAIQNGVRYVENDLNRMFGDHYRTLRSDQETQRAELLEKLVTTFFQTDEHKSQRYHYDLHTAIRTSLLPTFALLPYQQHPYDEDLLQSLNAADLDALVYHNETGKTFTHFSSEKFQAASATLELGKAKPFGKNDLSQFSAIHRVLNGLLTQQELPTRSKDAISIFKVVKSIIKKSSDFKLNLHENAPNFSHFPAYTVIAIQDKAEDLLNHSVWILFPNKDVKIGLRAGLLLIKD